MPITAPQTAGRRASGVAWALVAAGLAAALPGPGAVAAGQSVTVDIGQQSPNLIAPGKLIGDWLTIVLSDGKPQPVRLILHKVEPGKTAGKLIYSSPRRCVVDLEYGGPDEDRHIFYMVPFTNCFKYQKTDYVAIWMAEPGPAAEQTFQPSDGSDPADRYGLYGRQSAAAPVPQEQPVDRVHYAVTINDKPTETGLLARQ